MDPTPSPSPSAAEDGFQVHLDRRAVDVTAMLVLLVQLLPLVVVVVLGAALLSLDGVSTAAVGVPVVVLGVAALIPPLMGLLVWARSRRVDVPLELDSLGLHACGAAGELYLPWDAVASVTVEPHRLTGRQLRIRLVPVDDPRRGGLVEHVPARWKHTFDREGLRYSLRVLAVDPRELARQLALQSAGRVTLAPQAPAQSM